MSIVNHHALLTIWVPSSTTRKKKKKKEEEEEEEEEEEQRRRRRRRNMSSNPSESSILPSLFLRTLIFVLSSFVQTGEGMVRQYRFELQYQFRSPDCFQKLVITVNDQTPGPTIHAQQGDTVIVDVHNGLLTENTAIHWHGIRQIGTPWSDGTEGVTQCPILPGENFTYKFVVDRPGTYMYHGHYGMQRSSGLYGMIVVAVADSVVEPFRYDFDRTIVLNDWWHKSALEQSVGLLSRNFRFVNESQSLLIQGRGRFNCSLACNSTSICDPNSTDCSPYVLQVVPGKTYRLRIGSLTSLSALSFEIEGHSMTVVETDGNYVAPFVVNNLFIYSGETYSVLVKADQDPSRNYWTTINVVGRNRTTPTGLAIFNYYPNNRNRNPPTEPTNNPMWNDTAPRLNQSMLIRSHPDYVIQPPPKSDRTIILLNTQNKIDGYFKWAVNNVSFAFPKIPYLIALKQNITTAFDQNRPPETYDYRNYNISAVQPNPNATTTNSIYRLEFYSTVDVILQNANMLDLGRSETHPWHLHGHDFWVLGYGKGMRKYDPLEDWKGFNLVDPIMKNTVPLHPYSWTALRFRADNPGAWAFHCHIESHFFMGMGVVFEYGIDRVGNLPSSIMGCVPLVTEHPNCSKGLLKPSNILMSFAFIFDLVRCNEFVYSLITEGFKIFLLTSR